MKAYSVRCLGQLGILHSLCHSHKEDISIRDIMYFISEEIEAGK